MEGPFLAERAKGGAGDGRPPDSAEDSRDSRRKDDGIEGLSKTKYSRSAKRATLIFFITAESLRLRVVHVAAPDRNLEHKKCQEGSGCWGRLGRWGGR